MYCGNSLTKMTMKVLSILILIMGLFVFATCKREKENAEDLTIPLSPYNGNELKTNGYYYRVSQDNMGNTAYEIYFLYRNGVILYGGFPLLSELPEREISYSNGTYHTQASNKTSWGRYDINGNQIRLEKWFPSSGGVAPVYMLSGTIINDTLFHLTASRESNGNNSVKTINQHFHFKQFSPKPDSTNSYTNYEKDVF
jgi:hypothetical protein